MGWFKQFKSGAREAVYEKRANENNQKIGFNFSLFARGELEEDECISNVSYLTAEQIKYIVFNDIDRSELDLISFIISSSLIVYYYYILDNNNLVNNDLLNFHANLGEEVLIKIFINNKSLKNSHKDIYRMKFEDVFKHHKYSYDNYYDEENLYGDINGEIFKITRDYHVSSTEDYQLIDYVMRKVLEKFKKSIQEKFSI